MGSRQLIQGLQNTPPLPLALFVYSRSATSDNVGYRKYGAVRHGLAATRTTPNPGGERLALW